MASDSSNEAADGAVGTVGFATSLPGGHEESPDISPIGGGRYRVKGTEIVFERGAKNIPGTDEGEISLPTEVKIGTQVLKKKPVKTGKYVDDNISIEKLNFGRVPIAHGPNGPVKVRRAHGSQNSFRSITRRTRKLGMVVNNMNTQIMVVSDALNYTPKVFIEDKNGLRIDFPLTR